MAKHPAAADPYIAVIDRLLAQQKIMIEALVRNSAVEAIRAMNPPLPPATVSQELVEDPWAGDATPSEQRLPDADLDPWNDENVPLEVLRGWTREAEEA